MLTADADKLPPEARTILEKHQRILLDALGPKLVGIYVHGSLAMGGFTPAQSDIDYLAVVSTPLTSAERQELSAKFLGIYGKDVPAKGMEMSIVEEKYAGKEYRYPVPYEFHMGTPEQIKLHGRPHPEMTDPDLADHFVKIKQRGLRVYGKPIADVFVDVPRKDYLHSIFRDSEDCWKNILNQTPDSDCIVPRYAVLNLCRTFAFIQDDLITSKLEGADWGLQNLPDKYHPIIQAALQEYREPGSSRPVSGELLKNFARYAKERITAAAI